MITITTQPAQLSKRGAVSGSAQPDVATATWDGREFTARSANGASMKLVRALVEAGCPDQPWEVRRPDGQRMFHGDHLHRFAELTLSGGRFTRYVERPDFVGGVDQEGGEGASPC